MNPLSNVSSHLNLAPGAGSSTTDSAEVGVQQPAASQAGTSRRLPSSTVTAIPLRRVRATETKAFTFAGVRSELPLEFAEKLKVAIESTPIPKNAGNPLLAVNAWPETLSNVLATTVLSDLPDPPAGAAPLLPRLCSLLRIPETELQSQQPVHVQTPMPHLAVRRRDLHHQIAGELSQVLGLLDELQHDPDLLAQAHENGLMGLPHLEDLSGWMSSVVLSNLPMEAVQRRPEIRELLNLTRTIFIREPFLKDQPKATCDLIGPHLIRVLELLEELPETRVTPFMYPVKHYPKELLETMKTALHEAWREPVGPGPAHGGDNVAPLPDAAVPADDGQANEVANVERSGLEMLGTDVVELIVAYGEPASRDAVNLSSVSKTLRDQAAAILDERQALITQARVVQSQLDQLDAQARPVLNERARAAAFAGNTHQPRRNRLANR